MKIFRLAALLLALAFLVMIGMVWHPWRGHAPVPLASASTPLPTPLTSVSLRNPIKEFTTGQTPLLIARDRGYFAEQGLEVNLLPGAPEVPPIEMVSGGRDTFGMVGGPDTLLVARGKGAHLKAIAVLQRNSNFPCLLTLESSGLTKLSDLRGRKVGFLPGHVTTDVLTCVLRRNGVEVEPVNVTFDNGKTLLIKGDLAALWGFTVRAALELPAKGVKVNVLPASDYGIRTHGYTLFATEKFIAEHPDVCERLLRGIFKGIAYTLAHPEEAADELQKTTPLLTDRAFLLKSEGMYNAVTSHSEQYPMGYMDREMFANAYDYLNEQGQIAQPFNVDDAFTTQFVDRIHQTTSP